MVIAWLSLIVIQDRAEMAVLHDQNANLKAGVLKLQDTVTAAGADRYYGSEARRNNARLLKKIEQHTMKFCHDSACLSLVELKTDMSRLKEDVKDLEREYKSLARAMNGSIP
jgi:cell division protein FtsB